MEKKYELIKTYGEPYSIIALKDFTLITGEQIKKGDLGGFVKSEDCLSQDGLCWVMNEATVEGKVSDNAVVQNDVEIKQNAIVTGNAVIKDSAIVEGTVSGNAVVQDRTYVGPNATVTGNAVVQADQYINYGVVTTDLLGTNDLLGMLYAEFGIVPKDGKVILRMVMTRRYDEDDKVKYFFINERKTSKFLSRDFKLGKKYRVPSDHPPIYLSHGMWDLYDFAEYGLSQDPVIVEFEVYIKDIVGVKENCALVNKFTPLRVMLDEKQYMDMITNKGV
ncbi:MAG: polymer-forming cytoskeletal protein [Petrotogaceae bacterium]|jgi:NDP-sugar pyrophosphorylase family protein|nr:polymer-forming cytoskeletal protein [Petrotogaceae bacterium]